MSLSGFFGTLNTDFEKLFSKSPTFIHFTISFVTYAAPVVEAIEGFADPALVAPTQAIVTRIQTGLTVGYALASEGTSSGATLASTLSVLQADLAQLEAVTGVKDPATIAKIATLLAEIQAIASMIPASPTPTA